MNPLEGALARVPVLAGASAADATRLGGLTNLNFLVNHEGGRYVVRVPGPGTGEYIDRTIEEHAARSAAAAGATRSALVEARGGSASLVPSHCDPLCENFLDVGDRMYLIDYEYAGNNDPM